MSRIGKKPVVIPSGVSAKLDGQTIAVKGAKGELKFTAPEEVSVSIDAGAVHVQPRGDDKLARAMWGMNSGPNRQPHRRRYSWFREEARDQRRWI